MSKMISFKNTFQIHAFAQNPPIDSFCHSEQKPKSFWWHVRFPVQKDPLEKEIATHSNILAWKIPWTEKPGRLQSMGSQRVGHDWATSLHKVPLIWHPASSGTLPLIILTPQCPLHTTCMGFMVIPKYANLSHSICSGLKHSSSGYLPDFLPQNSDISSEITCHYRVLLSLPGFPQKQSLKQKFEWMWFWEKIDPKERSQGRRSEN